MAVTESDDAADIFWPGYVDAVTNLAINLLFVIAVMSIVVLGATLQIAQMEKRTRHEASAVVVEQALSKSDQTQQTKNERGVADKLAATAGELTTDEANKALAENPATLKAREAEKAVLKKALADQANAEKLAGERAVALAKLEQALQAASEQAAADKAALAKVLAEKASASGGAADQRAGVAATVERTEIVNANQKRSISKNSNQLQPISGGVVVVFGADVIELSDAESTELVTKMATFGALKTNRWQVQVISPKGFSEAVRLGYYRVNAVRNVLLTQGVPPNAIEMRVIESEQTGANNARVLVRLHQ